MKVWASPGDGGSQKSSPHTVLFNWLSFGVQAKYCLGQFYDRVWMLTLVFYISGLVLSILLVLSWLVNLWCVQCWKMCKICQLDVQNLPVTSNGGKFPSENLQSFPIQYSFSSVSRNI